MFVHDRVPNFPPPRVRAGANPRGRQIVVAGTGGPGHTRPDDVSFHVGHDFFRFTIASVNHQPTRTLRNPAAKENHDEPQRRADSKGAPPSEPNWNSPRIEEKKGC